MKNFGPLLLALLMVAGIGCGKKYDEKELGDTLVVDSKEKVVEAPSCYQDPLQTAFACDPTLCSPFALGCVYVPGPTRKFITLKDGNAISFAKIEVLKDDAYAATKSGDPVDVIYREEIEKDGCLIEKATFPFSPERQKVRSIKCQRKL